jgi:hypothetical protein
MATPTRTNLTLALTALLVLFHPSSSSALNTPDEPATTQPAPSTDPATTQKIVLRLYEATFGASERCKMAPPESAQEFKSEFARFGAKYPDLLTLLKSSPYYEPSRRNFLEVMASMAPRDTPQSIAAECKALTQLLQSLIDQPEGQKAVHEYIEQLRAK